MESGTRVTSDGCSPRTSPAPTAGASASPALTSASRGRRSVSGGREAAYFFAVADFPLVYDERKPSRRLGERGMRGKCERFSSESEKNSHHMRLVQDLEEKDRPAYLFIENVKNLLSVNGGADFLKLLLALDECGYDALSALCFAKPPAASPSIFGVPEWQIINSADYVPQNRERVFIIGHLRGRSGEQIFPIEGADGENHIQQIGNFVKLERRSNPSAGRIYAPEGIAPCLNAKGGGRQEPYIALPAFCDLSYGAGLQLYDKTFCLQARYNKGVCNRRKETSGVCVPIEPPGVLKTVRTEYGKQIRKDYESGKIRASRHDFTEKTIREDGLTNTLSTVQKDNLLVVKVSGGMAYAVWNEKYQCYVAIRKLTPKECFRLQGWEDVYFERAALVNSDSQLYKQAGNGVTVPVIYEIARRFGYE